MRRPLVPGLALLLATGCATDQLGSGLSFNAQQTTTISAEKTAEGRLTRTYLWGLEKTAAPETLQLFHGDDGAVTFTLTATRTGSVDLVSVRGEVCVSNSGDEPTEGLTIVDQVQYKVGDGAFQDLESATVTIAPEEQIAAGAEACYPYDIPFTPVDDATYQNVASVTITNLTGSEGTPSGPETSVAFSIPTDPTEEAGTAVTVTDSNGEEFTFDADGSASYDQSYTCDHAGENVNTATIVETGVEAQATVTVECFALDVTKTAETDYTRIWVWSLEKTSDTAALLIPVGFPYAVDYEVTPTAEPTAGNPSVAGTITITNPAPFAAVILEVVDTATTTPLPVSCGDATFPVTIDAGEALACTYAGDLPDGQPGVNTAFVVLQNTSYAADGTATESGTTTFTGSANIAFEGEPSAELDTCIDISDDQAGTLGTICLDALPTTLSYANTWGPYETCGEYTGVNTAAFVTGDTGAEGTATWTVAVTVPCGSNCTLGKGYWKNHSEYGPAPYDPTWALLPGGADQPFFASGYTWRTIMTSPPSGGDVYIKLGRQYAAAWLNGLHGADVSTAADDLERAAELLDEYDGDPSASTAIGGNVRQEFLAIAERLDDFNSGEIGPGSCDDDDDDDADDDDDDDDGDEDDDGDGEDNDDG